MYMGNAHIFVVAIFVTEIHPSRRGECFKAPCLSSGWMKMQVNNQTKIDDSGKLTIAQ